MDSRLPRLAAALAVSLAALYTAAGSVGQAANEVPNGSFETPATPPSGWNTYSQGQTFGGWTVGVGDIDHVGTYWQAADGTQSVNLNGNGQGSIYRDLATSAGQDYELRFAMAANGDSSPFTATVHVFWDGAEIATPEFEAGGHSLSDMGYERHTYRVTATQTVTRLAFASGNASSGVYGPVVDDVTLAGPSATAPTLSMLNAKDPPTVGKDVNVGAVKGNVLIAIPSGGARAAQKGVEFVPLEEARQIPVGSFLDTTNGTVALSSAKDQAGKIQTAKFAAGVFQVLQSRKRAAKGLTELRMKGSDAEFKRCGSGKNSANASALSRRAIRRLRAKADGRFRSRGRNSAATVRGTRWVMEDRCDGTLTSVKRGKVAVRDFRLKKTIVVTAGKSYLAAAAGTSNLFRTP